MKENRASLLTHLREDSKEEEAEPDHVERLEGGDDEELVPAGLGDVLQQDDAQRLHQRHALSHREGDVDAPVGVTN